MKGISRSSSRQSDPAKRRRSCDGAISLLDCKHGRGWVAARRDEIYQCKFATDLGCAKWITSRPRGVYTVAHLASQSAAAWVEDVVSRPEGRRALNADKRRDVPNNASESSSSRFTKGADSESDDLRRCSVAFKGHHRQLFAIIQYGARVIPSTPSWTANVHPLFMATALMRR
ncbi:hypothetical protein EVAR_96992_1 [Eumeta japonica]|uniref:Uncharacterized protein n=1 Tax=Eumeta variegata TaxID=151549 RepID=A0A4C1VCX1_EUMVA|nr:hypothetical protein EVAR_96992_1 [Eumeta japonica]